MFAWTASSLAGVFRSRGDGLYQPKKAVTDLSEWEKRTISKAGLLDVLDVDHDLLVPAFGNATHLVRANISSAQLRVLPTVYGSVSEAIKSS